MNVMLDTGTLRLDRATLDRAAALFAALAPHQLPLIRAVRDGLIVLVTPERGSAWPKRAVEAIRKPAIVVLGDDDGCGTGPGGWRCANAAVRWPRAAMVHASGGKLGHYAIAVSMAVICQRLLLIETDSAHGAAWRALLERHRVPGLAIVPPPGGQHPLPMPAERLQ